jgi:hypothetical protein
VAFGYVIVKGMYIKRWTVLDASRVGWTLKYDDATVRNWFA